MLAGVALRFPSAPITPARLSPKAQDSLLVQLVRAPETASPNLLVRQMGRPRPEEGQVSWGHIGPV